MFTWDDIAEGRSLPTVSYELTPQMFADYRTCVGYADAAYPTVAGRHPARAFDALVPEPAALLPNVGQESQYFNPPEPGSTLVIRARVLRKYSRRGKDYAVVEARTLDDRGRLIEVSRLIALRVDEGEVSFAPVVDKLTRRTAEPAAEPAAAGDGELPPLTKPLTTETLELFERAVWHRVPNVHSDHEAARVAGLRAPIASGQIFMGFIHEMLQRAYGRAWTHGGRISIRYVRPVEAGETVTVRGRPAPDGSTVALSVTNQAGHRVAVATATLAPAAAPLTASRSAPLAGLRVLEFTHAWAGPYAGMILADLGADVIKIERPTQDRESRGGYPYVAGESVPFLELHRNKRSVTIDLKQEAGRELLAGLLPQTDVVVQNFRPSVLSAIGIDYATLSARKPDLVYLSLSGYGSQGPGALRPGVNLVAQATAGICRTTDGAAPAPVLGPLCDVTAGMWGAMGVLAALASRDRTGEGTHVDVTLVDAGLSLMHYALAEHYFSAREGGRPSAEMNAPADVFQGADSRWFAVFASYPALWRRMCAALERPDLLDDPRFHSRESRTENAGLLNEVLAKQFAERDSTEWVDTLVAAGVPAAPVLDVAEALADAASSAPGMALLQHHPDAGTFPTIGNPLWRSSTRATTTVAPRLGADTDAVLRELGLPDDEVGALRARGVV
ncbi:MAG: CoA transferase [Pseudonocardia sp.]